MLDDSIGKPLLKAIERAGTFEDLSRKLANDLIGMGTAHFTFEQDKKNLIEFMDGTDPKKG